MIYSAGLAIFYQNRLLLAKPARSKKENTWSIPKGKCENNETFIQTAIRETREEVGICINPNQLSEGPFQLDFKDKDGELYKSVIYYTVYLKKCIDIGEDFKLPKRMLSSKEIADAKFMTLEEAEQFVFWRHRPVLEFFKV